MCCSLVVFHQYINMKGLFEFMGIDFKSIQNSCDDFSSNLQKNLLYDDIIMLYIVFEQQIAALFFNSYTQNVFLMGKCCIII